MKNRIYPYLVISNLFLFLFFFLIKFIWVMDLEDKYIRQTKGNEPNSTVVKTDSKI